MKICISRLGIYKLPDNFISDNDRSFIGCQGLNGFVEPISSFYIIGSKNRGNKRQHDKTCQDIGQLTI